MLLSTLITPRKEPPIRVAFFDDRIEIENPESKYNLKLSGPTPNYLSIDFYSRQPKELRGRNCYVIRTGKGNFAIFEENRFLRAVGVRERGSGFRGFSRFRVFERAIGGEVKRAAPGNYNKTVIYQTTP